MKLYVFWTKELSESCRVSCQNKFVKLVHLVGFIIKTFVTMQHGHVNVKSVVSRFLKNAIMKQSVFIIWYRGAYSFGPIKKSYSLSVVDT